MDVDTEEGNVKPTTRKFYGEKFHCILDLEGWATVGLVALLYVYMYYGFIWLVTIPVAQEYPILIKCILLQFHLSFSMTLFCWLQAMLRHPGAPIYEVIMINYIKKK